MAELYSNVAFRVRSYEVSIWTLQDRFVSILKWATMDQKGQIQDPEVTLRDDGTQEFTFTIPQYYQDGLTKISNPLWIHLDQQPIEANMHKLKVIFNKNTEDEKVLEFLVISVTEDHAADEVDITIKAEGLAFHELGKTGYKISLSQENYEVVENDWFDNGYNYETREQLPRPLMNIQFWNDLIFKDSDGDWRTNWTYEVRMDWSAFSNDRKTRKSDILYEDAYVSSWELQGENIKPRAVEDLREKERPIEVSESNYYNVTQTIAEQFGVFCKYEYEHNERYEITGRKVVYYNNYIKDNEGHIDLTYPYSSQSITRTSDNTELTTKLFVHTVDDEDYGTLSIMNVDANKSKEEYLLNFDYLIKIGAITEEQKDELKKFEINIRFLNDLLIENQERTRIVQNQLIQASANVTYYTNAVQLDKEQKDKAQQRKDSITDGTGWVHFEKSFVVMDGEALGYGDYINITLEGIDRNSITIYEKRLSSTGQTGVGYLAEIPYFDPVEDEYGNIIRLQHLARNLNDIDDSQVWVIGQYNPGSYYDNVIRAWEQRLIIDTAKLEEAIEEEQDLNWYLYGSRVGYGVADGVHLDGEYSGIGLLWQDGIGPVPSVDSRDYNQYIDYELDVRILNEAAVRELEEKMPNHDISKITYDYFAEDDIENSTPDLMYYFEIYTKQKEKAVNAFERMMGPALREGYWQPEDYNDYGDVYYDSFIINNSNPKTPYLNFIWDHNRYYEAEEPILYTGSASGDMRQHLIIKVGDYLPLIKDHLNDLFFAYRDPITYETVDKLKKLINNLSSDELDKIPIDTTTDDPELRKEYTILDATYVSLKEIQEYWNTQSNQLSGVKFIKEQHFDDTNDLNTMDNVIKEEQKVLYDNIDDIIINEDTGLQKKFNDLINATGINNIEIRNSEQELVETNYTNDNLKIIIDYLESINEQLDTVINQYDGFIQVEREILKHISNSDSTAPHSVSNKTDAGYPGHLEFLLQQKENAKNLRSLTSKALSWYNLINNYNNQIITIESNKDGYYRTYGIGADCELGWIIDQTQENPELIQVLIVTGTDTVSEEVMKYIQTGSYRYFKGTVTEGNEKEYETISSDITERCFLGYYATELKGANVYSYIEKIVNLVPLQDFIGDASATSIQRSVDGGQARPIEIDEYQYQRVYPRLYFSTLKLRDVSSKLRLKLNQQELFVNEDYYLVQDDRSKGLKTSGVGYYLTLRSLLLYKYECQKATLNMDVLYTLLNADTSIYLDAIKVSKENAFPKVSYEVELSIFNPEFIKTAYNRLNQIVHINDNDLKLEEVSGYISSITLKLDKPWEDTVEVKNYQTKFEDLFSTIVAQTEAMKKSEGGISNAVKAFNAYGFIDGDVLQSSMLKADLNLSFNKGTLSISQNDGIWGISDSGVVAFRGGGIFTATTKDGNGNWQWNTGILPTGINADLITSGQIDTNRIKIYSGDDVRFQFNSEGLFAYKDFDIESDELASIIGNDIPKNGIDSTQYVVYNSQGLFLTAKQGTWYYSGSHTIIDNAGNEKEVRDYSQVSTDISRVEVSWKGFILRNWQNEEVFFADPDTGNLTLKGTIEAEAGQIAGWNILPNMLASSSINIISGTTGGTPGIYLTNDQIIPESKSINGIRYYLYSYELDDEIKYCYYPLYDMANTSIILNAESAIPIIEKMMPVSVQPLYCDVEYIMDSIETSGEYDTDYTDEETSETETVTDSVTGIEQNIKDIIYYIVAEENSKVHIKNLNDEDIIYDKNTSINADWYKQLKDVEPSYEDYVLITYEKQFQETNEIPFGTELHLVGEVDTTFEVQAQSGDTKILQGQLGNILFDRGGLKGGAITGTDFDINNYYQDPDKTWGLCFYKIEADSANGQFILTRMNGETENFNIADMAAYKSALSAAGTIKTLSITQNGNVITATAETGLGTKLSKTYTLPSSSGSGGSSSGGSSSSGTYTSWESNSTSHRQVTRNKSDGSFVRATGWSGHSWTYIASQMKKCTVCGKIVG